MSEDKADLRRGIRRVRASIVDRDKRSIRLAEAAIRAVDRAGTGLGSGGSLVVLAFVGVGSEPDTSDLLARLAAEGHTVAVPHVEGRDLVAVRWDPESAMPTGPFGIPAPLGDPIDPTTLDVVIVPGLAFTADGRRLGQGGGFYDRYLPRVRADCLTIAIGFAEQVVENLPTEAHDRILDVVITDAVSE